MPTRLPALLLLLSLSAMLPLPAVAADSHAHGHADAPKLELNAGKKWSTDQALRQSMNAINQAMAEALPLIHRDQLSDDRYAALAATINSKIAFAVENCKLEPKADAMLHLVLADLLSGAKIMAGKGTQPRHDGAVRILGALKAYGEHFQHPNWKVAKG